MVSSNNEASCLMSMRNELQQLVHAGGNKTVMRNYWSGLTSVHDNHEWGEGSPMHPHIIYL